MEIVKIRYGRGWMALHCEKQDLKAVIDCEAAVGAGKGEEEIVRDALANPVKSKRLRALAERTDRIVVITSDHTRPVPSRITLPILLEEIRYGNPEADIIILVASGVHRATSQREMAEKFGEEIVSRERIVVHDAFAREDMRFLGVLPSGCVCEVNRLVTDADLVVAEGFIEPHFFAGYSGGRKSILPGVAGEASIRWNHCAKLIGDSRARTGILSGNPIHEDMVAAAKMAGLGFIMNVLLDEDKHIIGAFAGDMEKAHEAGCRRLEEMSRQEAVPAKVVVTSNGGYPLDQNVYQTVKSMTAAEACVEEGGVIICVAECCDGSGGERFVSWFSEAGGSGELLERIRRIPAEDTVGDQWQAQILARVMEKARVILVSDIRNKEIIESMKLLYCENVDEALVLAWKLVGRTPVVVIPDGVSVMF